MSSHPTTYTSTGSTEPTPSAESSSRGSLRTLWRVFGDRGQALRAALMWRVVASIFMTVPVVVVAWSIEHVRAETLTPNRVIAASTVVVLSVLGQFGAWYMSNRAAWVETFYAVGEGRITALKHVQNLPVGTAARQRTGDISAVLSSDYEQVAVFAHAGLITMIGGAVMPLLTVFGLVMVDPLLAGAVSVSIVAAVPVFLLINKSFVRQALARADALAAANARIVEYVQGVSTARSYNHIGSALGWYRDAVARMRQVNDNLAVRITPLAYASIGVVFVGVPVLISAVGYRYVGGAVDELTAVVFLVLVLRVYAPLVSVAIEIEGLRLTDAALRRIQRLHDLPSQQYATTERVTPTSHEITFDNVSFGYEPGQPVLHDVSFTAPDGATTALVGPSGAGKSTVLALAAHFYDPDAGEVQIGHAAMTDLTQDQLIGLVSVVFQDVYLFTGTVYDNIAFAAVDPDAPGTDDAVRRAAKAARCHEFIEALPQGYQTQIGEGGLTLSGGERQRISIARALLADRPIVLLDEATSALDPITEHHVHAAMAELCRGRTTLVVAHRLSTIRHADHIVVLDDGRVAEQGTHATLLGTKGRYAALWSQRTKAAHWKLAQ